ncbi:alpha-L-rhamnosidase N-terminal domain-containing protein, partial [candidate division KSB1 bacterium]|nr:alpha-L-rhamnosidase N-terminal domain-containing protein [candidate division KSB1 bacterium]
MNTTRHLTFKKLLCEYTRQPNNVDCPNPRFSWIIESFGRGRKQTAYRILVASDPEKLAQNSGDWWDSGKRVSSQTAHVTYEGAKLQSNSRYFWKVHVWDENGQKITSDGSHFHTALLDSTDWIANWIGTDPVKEPRAPAGFFKTVDEEASASDTVAHNGRSVLLRHEFKCPDKIISARVYVTGLGYYELYLNGQKIGDHVLAPAKTHYRRQVLYDTYDVTEHLKKGNNAVGIHLGNGWFNPYK